MEIRLNGKIVADIVDKRLRRACSEIPRVAKLLHSSAATHLPVSGLPVGPKVAWAPGMGTTRTMETKMMIVENNFRPASWLARIPHHLHSFTAMEEMIGLWQAKPKVIAHPHVAN